MITLSVIIYPYIVKVCGIKMYAFYDVISIIPTMNYVMMPVFIV